MKCRKCRGEISQGSKFCSLCGAKQQIGHSPKSRGNGQGSVYQLANKKWVAVRTVGYEVGEDGRVRRLTRSKSGFRTKKEALDYLPQIDGVRRPKPLTFRQIYDAWLPTHRAGKSTIDCYKAAMNYFRPVWLWRLEDITVDDLQECIDECPKGKRTRENMKALCGLLYKYAIPRKLTDLNMGQYLRVSGPSAEAKDALPDQAVKAIWQAAPFVPGADYVLCQCYLGFRPSELLELDVSAYDAANRAFVGGAKTDAGRDRMVTVSPKIQPIIDRLTAGKEKGPVFCGPEGGALTIGTYRALFYRVLEQCGVSNPMLEINGVKRHQYTPHSCRRTFATLMKRVSAPDKDKLKLMGHTDTAMLRRYQDVSLEDLRRITDNL